MTTLSRQLAAWIHRLSYEDLPAPVTDRAKGLILHGVSSILLGAHAEGVLEACRMIVEEEAGVQRGATILVHGDKVTKGGAAFVNSEMVYLGGKWDTFRMLLHPGSSVIPAALAACESRGASGKEFLTALVAGYEVAERLAADFIPTVMARGFHASPIFGIFGAAVAAAKLCRYSPEQLNATIALCASMACGGLEAVRTGGKPLREGAAVRNALFAVALA